MPSSGTQLVTLLFCFMMEGAPFDLFTAAYFGDDVPLMHRCEQPEDQSDDVRSAGEELIHQVKMTNVLPRQLKGKSTLFVSRLKLVRFKYRSRHRIQLPHHEKK